MKFLSARASLSKITDTVLIPSDTSATQSHISNRNPTLIPNSVCEGFGIHCHSTLQVKIQFVPLPHRLREEANAAILGIPSAFLDSEGSKLDTLLGFSLKYKQEIATVSPFYQPMLDKQTAEEICKRDFMDMDIKPDLRPGVAQLLNNHHAYLDTLPFAVFRERAINLICADPPMVDEGELFHDLLNNRLICWTLDQKGSNAAAMVSAPWDSRSWEAQPWFLRKW